MLNQNHYKFQPINYRSVQQEYVKDGNKLMDDIDNSSHGHSARWTTELFNLQVAGCYTNCIQMMTKLYPPEVKYIKPIDYK